MKRPSIRWRLTLWYGGVLALVLTAFSGVVFLVLRYQLLERIDQGLQEELSDVLSEVKRADSPQSLLQWLDRRFANHEGFDFQVLDGEGRHFFTSKRVAERGIQFPEGPAEFSVAAFFSENLPSQGKWRTVAQRENGPDGPLTIYISRSLADFEEESSEVLLTFALAVPLTLLAAVSGGYFLAWQTLRPVRAMTETANRISADRLDQRIPVENADDELGGLAETLNYMIERLEQSFAEMKQFTADAAHELRTPLAVIRNEAEVALRASRSGEEYRHVLEDLLEETNRLGHLAEQLLFLSRHDSGLENPGLDQVPIDQVIHEVVANMQAVAQEKEIDLKQAFARRALVTADPRHLRRLLYNLLDNAIKYTGRMGQVTIASEANGQGITISIQDTGIGISKEHLGRVFDRFYRVDPARSGESSTGLGLAICQSIVNRYGGTIQIQSEEGIGTIVEVFLPT